MDDKEKSQQKLDKDFIGSCSPNSVDIVLDGPSDPIIPRPITEIEREWLDYERERYANPTKPPSKPRPIPATYKASVEAAIAKALADVSKSLPPALAAKLARALAMKLGVAVAAERLAQWEAAAPNSAGVSVEEFVKSFDAAKHEPVNSSN
jgi:hypothetical protein